MTKSGLPYYQHAILIPSIPIQIFSLLPACRQSVLYVLVLTYGNCFVKRLFSGTFTLRGKKDVQLNFD